MTEPSSNAPRAVALARGREHLDRHAWASAFSDLSEADAAAPLEAGDLLGTSIAAHLSGRDARSIEFLTRAQQAFLTQGERARSARCAFWLGFIALFNGETAQAGGWLARAERLLEGTDDCVERGYLLIPAGVRAVREGNVETACQLFVRATAIGERFGDEDLVAIALNGQGRALIRAGDAGRGMTLLDQAMVAVTAGVVSPMVAGTIYCSVIESCRETLDLSRAQEWTAALNVWCENEPEMVAYRGPCLLHRAEILELRGDWAAALDEAKHGCERLEQSGSKTDLGAAHYRVAELHRLRGDFAAAEAGYRRAAQWELSPRPGLALLRLAQGKASDAKAAIRPVASGSLRGEPRLRALEAVVEIALADQDLTEALSAIEELAAAAKDPEAPPLLRAIASRVAGAVLLTDGHLNEALEVLRSSWAIWCELDAPYEAARTRLLIGQACRAQGDEEAARVELNAALDLFRALGAAPDLARVEMLLRPSATTPKSGLTGRELEVLKLVASGATNRQIAGSLGISEKTVARHLNNIFTKLDLPSRTAATAYAYRHELV